MFEFTNFPVTGFVLTLVATVLIEKLPAIVTLVITLNGKCQFDLHEIRDV